MASQVLEFSLRLDDEFTDMVDFFTGLPSASETDNNPIGSTHLSSSTAPTTTAPLSGY
jgi:hypothetical protein